MSDIHFTPKHIAKDCIEYFKPTGRILDPCRGEGVFFDNLPKGTEWCELTMGRDFMEWEEPVDWIMSNPPYSCFRAWLRHSMKIADNIVYFLPVFKVTNSCQVWDDSRKFGGIKSLRIYIRAGIPWQRGRPFCAAHWQRGWDGGIDISYYSPAISG